MQEEAKSLIDLQDPVEIVLSILEVLSEKEKDVIVRRFGLKGHRLDTLANIGVDYGVTRERIRQIQAYALKKMVRNAENSNLSQLHSWLFEYLKESGDIIPEGLMNKVLNQKYPEKGEFLAELRLACILNGSVIWEHNKVDFISHFRFKEVLFELIQALSRSAIRYLKERGSIVSDHQIVSKLQDDLKLQAVVARQKFILAVLRLDRRLTINDRGVSLTEWRHVNPRILFDKIMFILGEVNEPLHFTDIAQKIREKKFDQKAVSVQAVHNELINNPLFVLIGRGIYALKEWGYKEGTVAEVLEGILQERGPMRLHDLTDEVLQRRQVKPITIQINLNSKKNKFKRDQQGLYDLV